MRAIVKGKLYDTDKSDLIYMEEDTKRRVYRTAKGNFFTLYPTGEIQPKNEEAVKQYLGKNNIDLYIELFGEVEEA